MRFVVDESSLEFVGTERACAQDALTRLAFLLDDLREQDLRVGLTTGWGAIPCWMGSDLATVLSADHLLDRDERLLLLGLLDRCVAVDDAAETLDPHVVVAGACVESYGIALAHASTTALAPRACAVITLAHTAPAGMRSVSREGSTADLWFIVDSRDAWGFWRSLYEIENVAEEDFFALARNAFPHLHFAESLAFRRFDGSYQALRAAVVEHLSAIHDNWSSAYQETGGNAEAISTRLHISVSREGHGTRASEALMRLRDVDYKGTTYRCEWHSKLEPHRNRIHFHPAGGPLRWPLIGIFVDHLRT